MYWKLQALILKGISLLPSSVSYATFYWIQKHYGTLTKLHPITKLTYGIETWKRIRSLDHDPIGKVFFEVGTGRVVDVPLAYWLMGAEKTITVDLNPYLKTEQIKKTLQYISQNKEEIESLFGSLLYENRLIELLDFCENEPFTMNAFLDLCGIKYIAPGDAANTSLSPRYIDFHTSFTVLEHIRPEILGEILREGNRIIKANGLFIHRIDYSDHFAHFDKSISLINFLQYSDADWEKQAGNRYRYLNRLRHDDFISLFQSAGHKILINEREVNQQLLALVKNGGIQLDEKFRNKSEEVISIIDSWIVSEKSG